MTTIPNADERLQSLERWLDGLPGAPVQCVTPASVDASFRRYFRVHRNDGTQIAMDAPPEQEDVELYLRIARLLASAGVHVPQVLAVDLEQGFALISDLGSLQYLEALAKGADPEPLYADAIQALLHLQARGTSGAIDLPRYDHQLLRREMELFPEWFIGRHLGLEPVSGDRRAIEAAFDWLSEMALAQPVVLVHRDYHSRNLMVCPGSNPGILDFQDAVRGPVSYDLVSLLKDCYIVWPQAKIQGWIDRYREGAKQLGLNVGADREQFLRWFDCMGLQRHIKVLGIFARLWYRDGKPGFLDDLPRVLDYTLAVTAVEPAL
ncbi:MAG: phosphotransferase, partial [Gammaproteobacteria bacterium]|nr:phosphotransferase [Gammaproteobacteria bacterium]